MDIHILHIAINAKVGTPKCKKKKKLNLHRSTLQNRASTLDNNIGPGTELSLNSVISPSAVHSVLLCLSALFWFYGLYFTLSTLSSALFPDVFSRKALETTAVYTTFTVQRDLNIVAAFSSQRASYFLQELFRAELEQLIREFCWVFK